MPRGRRERNNPPLPKERAVKSPLCAPMTLCALVMSAGFGCDSGSSVSDPTATGTAPSVSDPSFGDIPLRIEQSHGNTPITPLDKEAAKIALDHWKLTKLGESFYVQRIVIVQNEPGPPRTTYELRNVHVALAPTEVTEADKLNGVEYHAMISLRADAAHTYSPEKGNDLGGRYMPQPPDTTWSKWLDIKYIPPLFSLSFDKANGKWSTPSDRYRFKQVEASDLPN